MRNTKEQISGTELIEQAKGSRIAITGSRSLAGNRELAKRLFKILDMLEPCEIIHGGAEGPDQWAGEYANSKGIKEIIFNPKYDKFGRNAPLVRNTAIAGACDVLVAIWDLKSQGTADTVRKTQRHKKQVIFII